MSLNILVVDDSAVVRSMIVKILKLTGLPMGQVHQASNGQEGLEVLGREWIDLALVDINMPVMNGEEMIEQVRQKPELENLPIIVVSTEGSQTRIDRLLAKGVHFIHKPFTPEVVRQVVQEVTGISNDEETGNYAAPGDAGDF